MFARSAVAPSPHTFNMSRLRAMIVPFALITLSTLFSSSIAFVPHPSPCSSRSSTTLLHAHGHAHDPSSSSSSSSLNYSRGDDVFPPQSLLGKPAKPPQILPNGGRITLVGAGPGLPDLLTLAAHRVLSDPDALVVVDRLVSPEIRDVVRGQVKVAKKHPGCAEQAQQEIYEWCIDGLREGRHVVRLKIGESIVWIGYSLWTMWVAEGKAHWVIGIGMLFLFLFSFSGDPFVFGRGGEEVLEFRKFGVEPVVIPGVSAAFSAPLLASIPVTHRGISNQVVMCTGYGRNNTSPDLIRYHKEQTVVFLMAVGRLRELCRNLVSLAGYPTDTPVAIVEKAGCPEQRTVVGTVDTIADLAERYDVKPPSTIIVGEVVNVLLTEEDYADAEGRVVLGGGLVTSVVDWQQFGR
ncbi:hypothetical protein ACHAXS_011315 [Conticribra weissflogii]